MPEAADQDGEDGLDQILGVRRGESTPSADRPDHLAMLANDGPPAAIITASRRGDQRPILTGVIQVHAGFLFVNPNGNAGFAKSEGVPTPSVRNGRPPGQPDHRIP